MWSLPRQPRTPADGFFLANGTSVGRLRTIQPAHPKRLRMPKRHHAGYLAGGRRAGGSGGQPAAGSNGGERNAKQNYKALPNARTVNSSTPPLLPLPVSSSWRGGSRNLSI